MERFGPGGATLVVTPESPSPGAADLGKVEYAVEVVSNKGRGPGRFAVAQVIARVFPDRMAFANNVIAEGTLPASDFPTGPISTDQLISLGTDALAYHTKAQAGGLGTLVSGFDQSSRPIDGVAFLAGADTDLTALAIRLPEDDQDLEPAIAQAFERANQAGWVRK
jgi:hypothetical protein